MAKVVDALVLGAGMVGTSVAAHLQRAGRSVALVDRQAPGRGTSYGNAGIVQDEAVPAYLFPRQLPTLARYAVNRSVEASYHPTALPSLASSFYRYWRASRPDRALEIARWRAPLILRSVADHRDLAEAAGVADLLRPTGWTQIYRREETLARALESASRARSAFGVEFQAMDADGLRALQPGLSPDFAGAVHYPSPVTISDPHALIEAYVAMIRRQGGLVGTGDAATLAADGGGWRMETADGTLRAREVVVALGPWSGTLTERFGYRPPLFVKRGYHMHYGLASGPALERPFLDADIGYVLAPMRGGLRLLTGAEFARHEARATPRQLKRAEPFARRTFPGLGSATEATAWLGSRPCLPDMLPVIGPSGREDGMWYAFGHAHQGLTLGPTTGLLLASMMTEAKPFTDPSPYRAERFPPDPR